MKQLYLLGHPSAYVPYRKTTMPRYHDIAKQANSLVKDIYDTFRTQDQLPTALQLEDIAEKLLRLYNLGIRTSPRPTQAVVRHTAVSMAGEGLPVRVGMTKVTSPKGFTYNALTIQHKRTTIDSSPTTLDDSQDEE